jgi:cell shape-determining protein MreC
MKYHSVNRARKQRSYIQLGLGIIAFILFVHYWAQFRSVVYPLTEPLIRGYGASKVSLHLVPHFVTTYFSTHKSLADRNASLELAIERLENQLAHEDSQLREDAAIASSTKNGGTVSTIILYPIAQDATRLYSTILLSKGFRNGIEKDALVYIRGQQAVCTVAEVYDKTSLCELLSKSGKASEGVTSQSSITLSLVGAGGGNFTAEVAKGSPVAIGETVYLRSDQNFTLGTVVDIQEEVQSTGATVYVRGAYNPVTSSVFYIDARYVP